MGWHLSLGLDEALAVSRPTGGYHHALRDYIGIIDDSTRPPALTEGEAAGPRDRRFYIRANNRP